MSCQLQRMRRVRRMVSRRLYKYNGEGRQAHKTILLRGKYTSRACDDYLNHESPVNQIQFSALQRRRLHLDNPLQAETDGSRGSQVQEAQGERAGASLRVRCAVGSHIGEEIVETMRRMHRLLEDRELREVRRLQVTSDPISNETARCSLLNIEHPSPSLGT